MSDTLVGRFVGPNKIASATITELVTPLGSSVVEVFYEDGTSGLYPEKGLAAVISDEPKDFNHLRDARVNLMVPEILNVIKEYDIPYDQFTWLMTQVAAQWQNHFNRANAILWFGTDKSYVPGVDTTDMLTITMAERINNRAQLKTDV